MKTSEVARLRLKTQGIAASRFKNPADVVRWFGAVQAQDYLGSLWALGLRLPGASEAEVERTMAERSIIRTWPLRGTLHFVAAENVRWMLGLLGARTIARAGGRYRQLGLDEATFAKSRRVLARALEGGRQLTRPELAAALEREGIATDGQRLIHLLNRSALEGLACYAARRGKQFTFALLEEWAPPGKRLSREEALAELAGRYFRSHGPATLEDFVWWSSLTTTDARAGLETVRKGLRREVFDGRTYWLASSTVSADDARPLAHLLPAFDEYTVAYKDRAVVLHPSHARRPDAATAVLGPTVIVDGRAVGTWKRSLKRGSVVIETNLWTTLKRTERDALEAAAQRYGEFLGLPAVTA
ncbi:MAG TPA: winged helix DNA-binding domain-containing protein [Pyrinomonadaceae bacterium]|nr:winged helix DNA-binding domain-containing protein [Pyrinomonadaceae bacterium]